MGNCQYCGSEIGEEETSPHLVRSGYSLRQFPLLSYKRIYLCPACSLLHQRKDKFEKILAIIALVVVISLLTVAHLILFGLI